MKSEVKTQIGKYDGRDYKLEYGRMCDVGAYDSKARRWFLTLRGNYIGDFRTKCEAVSEMKRICVDEDFRDGSSLHC